MPQDAADEKPVGACSGAAVHNEALPARSSSATLLRTSASSGGTLRSTFASVAHSALVRSGGLLEKRPVGSEEPGGSGTPGRTLTNSERRFETVSPAIMREEACVR